MRFRLFGWLVFVVVDLTAALSQIRRPDGQVSEGSLSCLQRDLPLAVFSHDREPDMHVFIPMH